MKSIQVVNGLAQLFEQQSGVQRELQKSLEFWAKITGAQSSRQLQAEVHGIVFCLVSLDWQALQPEFYHIQS